MTLAELGESLREARLRCGYSVDDVATRLKIMSRVVRAIEEGDEKSLPHAVYARGFIKAYAALVGIGEDEVRPVIAAINDPYDEAQPVQLAPPSRHERRSGGGNFLPALVVFSAMCFGFFWFQEPLIEAAGRVAAYVSEWGQPSKATPSMAEPATAGTPEATTGAQKSAPAAPVAQSQTSPQVSPPALPEGQSGRETPSSDATPAQTGSLAASIPPASAATVASQLRTPPATNADGLPANMTAPSANAQDSDTPRADAAPLVGLGGTAASLSDTTLTLQDGVTQTDVTRAGKGKHQIVMTALEECWVHSSADGTFTRQFSLKKGETFALSFESKLVVKLGNAGGVRIKYDGEELAAPGKSGQVRTITFPPAAEPAPSR